MISAGNCEGNTELDGFAPWLWDYSPSDFLYTRRMSVIVVGDVPVRQTR